MGNAQSIKPPGIERKIPPGQSPFEAVFGHPPTPEQVKRYDDAMRFLADSERAVLEMHYVIGTCATGHSAIADYDSHVD